MHRHPRRVSAAVLALLAGSAMTAFGVAPLTVLPSAPPPTITQVSEAVPLSELAGQLVQLDAQSLALYRTDVTRPNDTVDTLLNRLGINDPQAAYFLRHDPIGQTLLLKRTGKMIKVVSDNGRLRELVARGPAEASAQVDTLFTRLTVTRDASGALAAHTEQAPLLATSQLASGTIASSLYAAADDAHVPDAITNQIAEIFSNDIDFRRELRKGDAFSVLYEAHTADGEPITWGGSSGRVLAARFINKDKTHDAVWFQEPGRKGAYYDLNGRGKTRAFLASPLAFSRVTSGFAMRFHPLLQRWKAHLGTDYGAPTGTAVRTVGDGRVSFAGQQNGYGNVIQIQHSGDRLTVYAHLSRINVRPGQTVEQGQLIGAVGATGWATGPHLHFEFRIKGHHVDPMIIARASESTQLSPLALAQFRQMAVTVAQRLDTAGQQQLAGAHSSQRFE
ncbi:MAG: M23 family metallopeptidase [Burkholderiales bacterium]|nr:M23 family metallopeptidase [Burkholderiales bacterium]